MTPKQKETVDAIAFWKDRAARAEAENERLRALVNTPELNDFSKGVVLEAQHQRDRWGVDHDAGKSAFDWFWLIGYLAQKAADASVRGDADKAKHHTISTAAALANWHAALNGDHARMRPGIAPPALAGEALDEEVERILAAPDAEITDDEKSDAALTEALCVSLIYSLQSLNGDDLTRDQLLMVQLRSHLELVKIEHKAQLDAAVAAARAETREACAKVAVKTCAGFRENYLNQMEGADWKEFRDNEFAAEGMRIVAKHIDTAIREGK
jgi:hypothetical protein